MPDIPTSAKLLVVGGDEQGPYRALAQRLGVEDRVIFAGHSPRVEDFFAAADIFVFPTLYEAFALVTLEAAAAGLPLVTTKVNGTEDFVVDGENGLFIERDAASIAAAVSSLVADPARRERMGRSARNAVAGYTWSSVAARTREVYDEIAMERVSR